MDLLYAFLNLPEFPKAQAVNAVSRLDETLWWWCNFRHCDMLPLCTEAGLGGKEGTKNKTRLPENFQWTSYAPPVIRDYVEDHVFPWLGTRSRVVVIRTQIGAKNTVHIDTAKSKFGTRQHKFRIVMQGRVDSLYFVTKQGPIFLPPVDKPFIMDGSWPHGMTNFTDQTKYTLAIGEPWTGNEVYEDLDFQVAKQSYDLPEDYDKYFEVLK